jgi:MFS family permease
METTMSGLITKNRRPILGGTWAFGAVWFGQVISFIGSGLTSFALGVWVLQRTGEITQYALISMFFVLPGVLLGPLAGTLVDRWDRRKAMLIRPGPASAPCRSQWCICWAGCRSGISIWLCSSGAWQCGCLP